MPATQKGGDSAGKNMTPKTYRKWNPSGDRTLPPPTIGQSSTTIYLEELCKAGLVTSSSNKLTVHRKWQQTYIICNRTSVTKICLPDLSSDSSCRIQQQFRRPKSAHAIESMWTHKKNILITYSLLHYSSSNILKSPRAPIAKKQRKVQLASSSSSSAREALDSLMMLLIFVLKLASCSWSWHPAKWWAAHWIWQTSG